VAVGSQCAVEGSIENIILALPPERVRGGRAGGERGRGRVRPLRHRTRMHGRMLCIYCRKSSAVGKRADSPPTPRHASYMGDSS